MPCEAGSVTDLEAGLNDRRLMAGSSLPPAQVQLRKPAVRRRVQARIQRVPGRSATGRDCHFGVLPGSRPWGGEQLHLQSLGAPCVPTRGGLTEGMAPVSAVAHLGCPSTRWETIMGSVANAIHREPWNKGKIVRSEGTVQGQGDLGTSCSPPDGRPGARARALQPGNR